jgi:hypothetical protein
MANIDPSKRPGTSNLHENSQANKIAAEAAAEMAANKGPGQALSKTALIHGNTLKKVTDPNIIGLGKAAQ